MKMSNKINLFLIFCVFSVVRSDAKVLRGVTINVILYII